MLLTFKAVYNRFIPGWCFALLMSLIITNDSLGADRIQQYLSLKTAAERALKQNPQLRGFRFLEKAIDGQLSTAKLSPAFKLRTELNYDAGGNDTNHTELTISLSSIIELGAKPHARTHLVNMQRLQLEAKHQIEALDLLGEVTRMFIGA